MNTDTAANEFPIGDSNPDASTEMSALALAQAQALARRNRNGKGKGKSKIPKRDRLNQYRDLSVIRTNPVTIVRNVTSGLRERDTLMMNLSDSDSDLVVKEDEAKVVDSEPFASSDPDLDLELELELELDLDLPLSLQHQIPTGVTNMSSPLSGVGKSLPTTALSTSEPMAIKSTFTPTINSPQLASDQMASPTIPDTVPNSYESYTSFMYTPPDGTSTSLPPQSDQKTNESSLSGPLPKISQSTPLLPAHRHSIRDSRKSSVSTLPPGFYEYHTISGTVIIPRASEHGENGSGSSSGYVPGFEPGTSSLPSSSRSSLREKCKMAYGMKPSLLCAYILCGFCLAWLMWMSWTTISSKRTGNRGGAGSNGIGGHVLPYGAGVPVVNPFKHARAVKEVVPTAEASSPNFGVNTYVDPIDEITTSQFDRALNQQCDEESKREDMKKFQ
ncbi:06a61026-f702-4c59-be54-d7da3b15a209-CDS [Sclerotinia trifoliorum]|uniref:06a61026-f702-4c59-be54-d7da3b15a209-CDS n=1 Tax=Sclerotinia trifoliorum TaxID=28548 RepID=A0A8H2VLU6_9HELO|nr:06a61026-f702-4c59-be54-d7da3b15a209-CDS [Sclerotinia trifoliorum]